MGKVCVTVGLKRLNLGVFSEMTLAAAVPQLPQPTTVTYEIRNKLIIGYLLSGHSEQ